jgi:hypothetical protein
VTHPSTHLAILRDLTAEAQTIERVIREESHPEADALRLRYRALVAAIRAHAGAL